MRRFNKAVTPQSVTVWFKRHPDVKEQLEKAITQEELSQEEVHNTIFENRAFEETISVETWIRDLRKRKVKRRGIREWIAVLKRICQGVWPRKGIDLKEHGCVLKHPDRLGLGDCILFMDLVLDHYPDLDISSHARVMRRFLESKGAVIGQKIPASAPNGAAKMADLYVERSILNQMLRWIKEQNYEAYVVDLFMHQTATRIAAALNALLENITEAKRRIVTRTLLVKGKELPFSEEALSLLNALGTRYELNEVEVEREYREIRVFDKGSGRKYPEGRPCDKYLSPDLFKEVCNLTGYPERRRGPLFHISQEAMTSYNRQALEKFVPWVFEKHPDLLPNHFWRHMFAQHVLRETDWNYAAVASLGTWSVSALDSNYGKAPGGQVRKWGLEFVPSL